MATDHKYKMPYLNKQSIELLEAYGKNMIDFGKKFTAIRDRMDIIDEAYARYRLGKYRAACDPNWKPDDGVDRHANVPCDITQRVVAPIVVSQVDTLYAYLCDVYLSGYPIFPVASTYNDRQVAEVIEALIDDHATIDRYPRQLKMAFLDAVKYNMAAVETSWAPVFGSEVVFDPTAVAEETTRTTKPDYKHINRLKRVDMRNAFWDTTVLPCDIAAHGEMFGFTEKRTRIQLIKYLQYLHDEGYTSQALKEKALKSPFDEAIWNDDPIINIFLQEADGSTDVNWENFWTDMPQRPETFKLPQNGRNLYAFTRCYVRIVPSEFKLSVPSSNTVQIWCLEFVNGCHLVSARPVQSPTDEFPVSVGQSIEDGLGLQTQSAAEQNMDIQEMVSFLMNTRVQGTRRAIGDRAVYDPEIIHPDDINHPSPTSKIPARASSLLNRDIRTAYFPIPFDNSSTLGAIQDATILTSYSKELNGTNNATQGQFQKGNKSVTEFSTVMSNAENRMRLLALTIEMSLILPTKQKIKYNVLVYGQDAEVTSPKNGKKLQVVMAQIIEQGFNFEVADGYTPKSKIANTEVILAGLNVLSTNQLLVQQLGAMLPAMFIHFMSLSGVKGIEEYLPTQPQVQQNMQQPTQPVSGAQ